MRKLLAVSLVLGGFVACGGGSSSSPPPNTASSASATTSASSESSAASSASSADTSPPPAAKVTIAVAAMKFVPAKGKKSLEVKADGSVTLDGKAVGKFSGDHLEDGSGKTVLTLAADGSLSGEGMTGWKFDGDDLVAADGSKVAIADDGTATASGKKKETIGKFEGGGAAKRAAALLIVAMLTGKPVSGPAAASVSAVPAASAKPPKK